MRIETGSVLPPEVERPKPVGAAVSASLEISLHSNDASDPVAPVQKTAESVSVGSETRSETVWIKDENKTVFRVLDGHTGEVVRQLPSDEVLKVEEAIGEQVEKQHFLDLRS